MMMTIGVKRSPNEISGSILNPWGATPISENPIDIIKCKYQYEK
jgi:hypothetical protein